VALEREALEQFESVAQCRLNASKHVWCNYGGAIDSPCVCEHNNPDSLDSGLFPSVVLAVAPAVTMDEASSLSQPTRARVGHDTILPGG